MPTGLLEAVPPFRSRSLSESTLFRGLGALEERPIAVIEPCACGTSIVALSDADEDVLLAVRSHQRLPEHQLYRLRMGGA
jgi:hypothetical protein